MSFSRKYLGIPYGLFLILFVAACTADGNGIDNWGNSTDSNGFVFPFFASLYDTDSNVKKAVDSAADYSKQTILTDGTSGYSVQYPTPGNTNSSGMNLAFFAQYNNPDVNHTDRKSVV